MLKLFGEFSIYYFCLKASRTPDFDASFCPFMDDTLKGDSVKQDASSIKGGYASSTPTPRRSPTNVPNDVMEKLNWVVDMQKKVGSEGLELRSAQIRAANAQERLAMVEEIKTLETITKGMDSSSERYRKYHKRINDLEKTIGIKRTIVITFYNYNNVY